MPDDREAESEAMVLEISLCAFELDTAFFREARSLDDPEHLRDERRQHQRGRDGRARRHDLHIGCEPEDRLPQRPDFHEVSGATRDNEGAEGDEDPAERQAATGSPDEPDERQ
jgi:hypothetical protein